MLEFLTELAIGVSVLAVVGVALGIEFWFIARQYHRCRRKGYRHATAQILVFGAAAAAFGLFLFVGAWLPTRRLGLPGALVVGSVLLAPPIVAAAVVRLLPRHVDRRAGARRLGRFGSLALRLAVPGFRVLGAAAALAGVTAFWWWTPAHAVRLLGMGGSMLAIPDAVRYMRRRLDAPGLDEVLAAERGPAVLYLRSFEHEGAAFRWLPTRELHRYTSAPPGRLWIGPVTLEQYLGPAFAKELGPLVALGNPVDVLPPEGAARHYTADEGWRAYFLAVAAAATAFVMEAGHSDNLHWELTTIRARGWQNRLFVVVAPASSPRRADRILARVISSSRVERPVRWSDIVRQLGAAGYAVDGHPDPGPGAVLGFADDGRVRLVARGAVQPEDYVGPIAAVRGA